MAFNDAHHQLVDEWSTQRNAFGDEALDHLDDVSQAPASPQLTTLSDDLAATIGATSADPGQVTIRSFAEGTSSAIAHATDSDQDAALSAFLGLQAHADTLPAVLDQIGL